MTSLYRISENIFDSLENFWDSKKGNQFFSYLLVISFIGGLLIALPNYFGALNPFPFLSGINFFATIHFSFTILLLIEMAGLLFVIPQSIANYIAKQFENVSHTGKQ